MYQINITDIGEVSPWKLQHTNSSVMLGFVRLIKCRRSFIWRVRFYSIVERRAGCNKECLTDMGLLSGQLWGAIHLSVFSSAGAPYPLVKLPEKGCVSLVLCSVPNESVNKQVLGREAALGVYRTWADPYLKCFLDAPWSLQIFFLSCYIELLALQWFNLRAWSDAVDVSVSCTRSRLIPASPGSRAQGWAEALAAPPSPAPRWRCAPAQAVWWPGSPVPTPSTACQPQLLGRSLLGPARSLWHMASPSGRAVVTPGCQCVRCQGGLEGREVRGPAAWGCTGFCDRDQTEPSLTLLSPFPNGTGFQTGVLFC